MPLSPVVILSSSQVIDYGRAGKDLVHSLILSEIEYRIEVVPPLGRQVGYDYVAASFFSDVDAQVFVCFRLYFTRPGN